MRLAFCLHGHAQGALHAEHRKITLAQKEIAVGGGYHGELALGDAVEDELHHQRLPRVRHCWVGRLGAHVRGGNPHADSCTGA